MSNASFGRNVRVVLADDHELVRIGFKTLLEQIAGIEVIGEAGDGHEAVALAEQLRPDLILMDVLMPRMGGIEATQQIAARYPEMRIIILSGWGGEHADAALKAGALGYVMKGSRLAVLRAAIGAVLRGEVFSSASIDDGDLPGSGRGAAAAGRAPLPLSGRQGDVFQLLVEGKSTADIAQILDISQKTADSYRTEILQKLGLRDVPALIGYAVAKGLLPAKAD